MERFVGGRLESVDLFADSGDNKNEDEDMFGEEDDMELIEALEQTNDVNLELDEEHCPSPPEATPLETLPGFDLSAGRTWIYPCNMSHRSYQFNIVQSCLFKNTLVCLPTGLGKTFIAAVVMYNFYRWYPQGKIVFMAPTKPLVGQQIEACFKIMGIPQEETKEMTGSVSVKERNKAWASKRVFFLTPQVMNNDLSRGLFPAKEVKLLIVDEAHKAQGEYAYCQVARELNRAKAITRIVALSATPGTDIASVKSMLQNLFISHIELRHEESPDILPYTHARVVDKVVIPLDSSIKDIKEKLLGVMEIYVKRLSAASAVRKGHNPSAYTKFAFIRSRDEWRQNPPGNVATNVKGQVEGDFAACIKLYHGMELLTTQGLRSFYNFFNKDVDGDFSTKRIKGELSRIPQWRDILAFLTEMFSGDVSNTVLNQNGPVFSQAGSRGTTVQQKTETSHPKMDKLMEIVQEHFVKFTRDGLETRVIIFSQFRDCVTELVACLASLKPTVRPMPFIGQSGAGGKKGLTQKEQLEVVRRFKDGGYNTLVATCVGEEGLDIGEVDLIVLYDVAKSPIRLVQRMGRTGRKRDGRIVVLVTEGLEERNYNQSLYNKKIIHNAILDKEKLEHALYSEAPRMVPIGLEPVCHRMKMMVGSWKTKNMGKGVGQGQGMGIQGYVKKLTKDDMFRENCGFLTEADEERWRRDARWEGNVKMVKRGVEVWTGKGSVSDSPSKQGNFFDLSEFSLWQTGDQHRRCVGSSSVSSTYRRVMEMMGDKTLMQKRVEEVKAAKNNHKSNKVKELDGSQNSGSRLDRSKESFGGGNNILNYFKPSQNKSWSQIKQSEPGVAARKLENKLEDIMEVIELDQSREEIIIPNDNIPEAKELVSKEEGDEEETRLLCELLDDSGVCSLQLSPPSPPSLQRLLDFPPSKEEADMFDVAAAIQTARERIMKRNPMLLEYSDKVVTPVTSNQELVVMPVEQNNDSLEDMFADDDSAFDEIDFNAFEVPSKSVKTKELPIEDNQPVKLDQEANFDLESPVVSPVVVENPPNHEVSLFDLGNSPVMVENEDLFEEENPAKPPNMKFLSVVASGQTSTPLPGHLKAPSGLNLTPVQPVTSRRCLQEEESPLVCRMPHSRNIHDTPKVSTSKMKLSEDLFHDLDSDDEMFQNVNSKVEVSKEMKKSSSKSMFSATQLVNMLDRPGSTSNSKNEDSGGISRHKQTSKQMAGSRRKLSNLFDEYKDMEVEIPKYFDEECQYQAQMDLAIEESLKLSRINQKKESQTVEVFDLSESDKSQGLGNCQNTSDQKVERDGFAELSDDVFSQDMFPDEFTKPISCNEKPPQKSSDESINLLEDKRNVVSSRKPPVQLSSPPASPSPTTTTCPVCNIAVSGDVNQHLDDCLSQAAIKELAQEAGDEAGPSHTQARRTSTLDQPGLLVSSKERKTMVGELSSSSDESLLVVGRRGRNRVLASQSQESSSRLGRGESSHVYHGKDESDDSPVGKNMRRGRARIMASQGQSQSYDLASVTNGDSDMQGDVKLSDNDSTNNLTVVKEKKKRKKGQGAARFLEVEAEVSGESGSDDECDEADDRYDESFVDDATQATDTAVYLRSIKSPEFRKPQQRVLPPITEDIFSQAVGRDSEDSYEEDSFCVGSQQVEWDSQPDTLELLERRTEGGRRATLDKRKRSISPDQNAPGKRRKRIIAPASDDETVIEVPDNSPKKSDDQYDVDFEDFNSSFPDISQSLLVKEVNKVVKDDRMLLQPDMSTSMEEAEKLSIIISSTEVNKVPEVISSLKHMHHLSVSVRQCEVAGFLISLNMAVHRVSEAEFCTGTLKDRLVQKLNETREQYSKTALIVEWARVKPGEKPKSGARTKQMDLIVGQLAAAGIRVMYSSGQLQTANILAKLVEEENEGGYGLPRPLRLTVWQEEMVKWLLMVPRIGLTVAIKLAIEFSTLRELITASMTDVMRKGKLDRKKAEGLVSFFMKTFQPELTDLAPL